MIDTSNLLEIILARGNMILAMKRVIRNKGSHGVDGMKTDELRLQNRRILFEKGSSLNWELTIDTSPSTCFLKSVGPHAI